jgi:RNA polymerase sigma factor (sigma-70 family)
MSATTLTFAPGSFMTDHVSSRARFRKAAAPVQAPKALTSVELLARARAGDELALNDLCARYLPRLQKWAHGRLPQWARGGAVETVDIVHDTLAQVVQRLGTFEPRHDGAFQAFLRTSLHNRICDQIRWAKRRPTDALATDRPDEGPSPFELAIGVEARERYEAALQRLKAPDREAIIARIELGHSYPEVARALGKPTVAAAHVAVSRALVKLAKEMAIVRRS